MVTLTDIIPPDEAERLAAVRRYDILDTPPDGSFDRITRLAARLFDVPIATITIVDHDRIWFKSAVGVEVDEIGRDPGLCASAILEDLPYVVNDASVDPRALDNPLVRGELGLRFYAGIPLRTRDGYNLGTLNIIDARPRELGEDELETLHDLAGVVVDELELRLEARTRVRAEAAREASRVRDDMLASVSHEMRTPMAVLRGILELPESTDETQLLWPTLRRQVSRLDWLVNQFLDFATIREGERPQVRPRRMELAPIVAEAVDAFADQTEVEVDLADVPDVNADPDRVRQVLIELLDVGTRSSSPETPLRLVAEPVGDVVCIDVVVAGPDVTAATLARLLDEPTGAAESTAGTGIGLFVSRELATAQGAGIDVLETDGDRLLLRLELPVAEREGG